MMRQYRRIKSEIDDDVLLMFRLGDFYEMFFEDAKTASPILGVALTKRAGSVMCGVPYHALDAYLAKLVRAGRKIAICDQMEDPALAKGIVRREITRVVTPGTVTEENILADDRNNYLAAVAVSEPCRGGGRRYAAAALDLSTGELVAEMADGEEEAVSALRRIAPGEGIVPRDDGTGEGSAEICERLMQSAGVRCVTPVDSWLFDAESAVAMLERHFGVRSLDGFGCGGEPLAAAAAGALLQHVRDNLRRDISHVRRIRMADSSGRMVLDDAACRHLDLLPGARENTSAPEYADSLYGVLNATRTPMGARLLYRWIQRPLCDVDGINGRLDAVECLVKDRKSLTALRTVLGEVRDLERTIARISLGRGGPRDVLAVASALKRVPAAAEAVRGASAAVPGCGSLLLRIAGDMDPLPELSREIESKLNDPAPAGISEGGVIRDGVDPELDDLRSAASDARAWIAAYQAGEVEKTGIKTLKVKYNKVFGYFIEVSAGQAANVPERYIRKQTMVNGERFTTPELKEREEKISGAAARALELEQSIFEKLRAEVVAQTVPIQTTARALAEADVLASLADRALALGYVRPRVNGGDSIIIEGGRHPVIEQLPDAERFVPNDTRLDCSGRQIMVITGPNMAGKSTYIRQVAMIVVMAQTGSFVSADSAEIGVVDRVFTRVGASDDLVRGRSTFMVEMQETANILNNATPRSLIVLDEIGRGTSTFDGISIAWAVAEYLHNTASVKAKTLFATHYHELTALAATLSGAVNCSVMVKERGDGIVFLRKITDGAADKSYGIAVAKLAGMPDTVIERAGEILTNLESDEFSENGKAVFAESRNRNRRAKKILEDRNLLLFEGY